MLNDWLNLYKQIRENQTHKENLICPECGNSTIDFQYVGRVNDRMGYLSIWCVTCNKGAHFSRVAIPEGFQFFSFDNSKDTLIARIPNFEPVS